MDVEGKWVIKEVEPDEADAVLALRVSIPGVLSPHDDLYYLARVRSEPAEYTVESVFALEDGTIVERGTFTSGEVHMVSHHTHADGVTAEGRGCGFSKSVTISGHSLDAVTVDVSLSWTGRGSGSGRVAAKLVVPWLGSARQELGHAGWISATITPAGGLAAPISAPDGGQVG